MGSRRLALVGGAVGVMSSSITHPVQPSGAAEWGGAMAVPSAPVKLAPGVDLQPRAGCDVAGDGAGVAGFW